jgi:hypothetical protein
VQNKLCVISFDDPIEGLNVRISLVMAGDVVTGKEVIGAVHARVQPQANNGLVIMWQVNSFYFIFIYLHSIN